MPTLLTKDVTRETLRVTDRKGVPIVVTLKAGDMLEFRGKGRRTTFEIPLQSAFYLAMVQKVHDEYKAKLERYKEKKALGQRCKRPTPPSKIFANKLYRALE